MTQRHDLRVIPTPTFANTQPRFDAYCTCGRWHTTGNDEEAIERDHSEHFFAQDDRATIAVTMSPRQDVPADAPSVSELSGGTPIEDFLTGSRGFVVITNPRRLTLTEWVRVHLLRRPDPRVETYPVEAHPRFLTPGPDTQTFTVSWPTDDDSPPMTDSEWRKAYERQWCPGPAEYKGHLLPCSVGEVGHEGDCAATSRDIARHRLAGQVACIKHNCGR